MSDDGNLFAQQQANRRRSTWLTIGFILFFAWVGFGGDLAFWLLTADAPPGSYHHVVPFIGIFSVLLVAISMTSQFSRRCHIGGARSWALHPVGFGTV